MRLRALLAFAAIPAALLISLGSGAMEGAEGDTVAEVRIQLAREGGGSGAAAVLSQALAQAGPPRALAPNSLFMKFWSQNSEVKTPVQPVEKKKTGRAMAPLTELIRGHIT